MDYLITFPTKTEYKPFLTKWFDYENHFEEGMIVYNIRKWLYTTDGKNWKEIELDHL